ncbi:MAG TPA: NAD(P)H-dependent oxidoreductase [Syntrophales bacterium]|jgi:NAD(P)H dehydrogenase (quinone)|nr:NAD(P)H-dependent oxidoreductase [Syntrophales bacterium]HON24013.1 NAD(P)H-dependent oxidoreductase [Syntrophales bacterium]HOU78862.1 NAD(P)H-dependent oxidoreductase [Syntrophales bacterium]HPC33349.1 NAD(P)H-dependent oxidoreductase [Syntrophales bacterium]HQG35114.1 NAD(P)H-dependent oxidoreductase [Syntrophales bacterium]
MKSLIVYCHPNPKSFNHAILETVSETLVSLGREVVVRDLYALSFDPVLKPADFEGLQSGNLPADIIKEQEFITWADALIVIHPLWWTGLPAMFKGYIDRVFCYGFAYSFDAKGLVPHLRGKKILIINTQGTPRKAYEESGMFGALQMTSDKGIYGFCGLEIVDHLFLAAVPMVKDEVRRGYLEEVREAVAKL